MLYPPPKPSQDKSPIWVWLDYLVKWATSERVFIQGWQVTQRADGKYFVPPNIPPASKSGGYKGEYDPTKAYAVGDEFKISTPLTITVSGTDHIIVAGLYGVRPAATAVDSQGLGPWAGTLPANPASAGIDMDKFFFNPQIAAPSFGAAPNDKLYAEIIVAYC